MLSVRVKYYIYRQLEISTIFLLSIIVRRIDTVRVMYHDVPKQYAVQVQY